MMIWLSLIEAYLENYSVFTLSLGSLSNSVFERRTSTGSGLFASLGSGSVETLGQIVFIREKKLSNTNLLASRHMRREKASLSVDVRRSKTSLLKFPIISYIPKRGHLNVIISTKSLFIIISNSNVLKNLSKNISKLVFLDF